MQRLWGLLYADDAGIVSRSSKRLERMMTVIVTACSSVGLTVSESNQSRGGGVVHNQCSRPGIQTLEFVYLSGAVTADRELYIEIKRGLQRA